MHKVIFIIIAICVIATIIFLIHYYSKKQRILRILSKLPHKFTSGLKTNQLAKVIGKALHIKEPLIAPYTNRKCVFYHIKIEQKVKSGKSSHWKTLIEDEQFQDFFIDVNGEYVIIQPNKTNRNYMSYLVKDKTQNSGSFNDPTPRFSALLEKYNINSETFLGFNKRLRYQEGVIEVGETIAAAGLAKWLSFSEPLPEYPYSKIVTLVSSDTQPLIITDLPEAISQSKRRRKV